ncbi:MAG: phosphoribosyltransferase [Pseudomonadota bacterium]
MSSSVDFSQDYLSGALDFSVPRLSIGEVNHIEWLDDPIECAKVHLEACINRSQPDLIIVLERKGRALIRGIIDETNRLDNIFEWQNIVSSNSLDSKDKESLENKKILIFDDTCRTGTSIAKLVSKLRDDLKLVNSTMFVSVVGSHQDGAKKIQGLEKLGIPVWSYFKNLSTRDFHILRKSIIDQIRNLGALMLDTEHVEFRFSSSASFREITDALGRNADTIVFESGRNIKNITVYYGDSIRNELPADEFPNCRFTNIVKKVRIIQSRENEYTVIPLCLPSVPNSGFQLNKKQVEIFGGRQPQTAQECFYQVGLLASIHVLAWAIKDLSASIPKSRIQYKYPISRRKVGEGGYDFLHLLPIYPTLDIKKLTAEVSAKVGNAKQGGIGLSSHRKGVADLRTSKWNEGNYSASRLNFDAVKLLQCIANGVEKKEVDNLLLNRDLEETQGLRAREVFNIGSRLDLPDAEVSALFDILIDNAALVTKIDTVRTRDGIRCVRTFKPDGEIMTTVMNMYTRRHGLPYEILLK